MTTATAAEAVQHVGRLEAYEHDDGRIEILHADEYVYVSVELLVQGADWWGFYFDGDCLVMAGQVWYRPVGFAQNGRALVCQLVRDERPPPSQP